MFFTAELILLTSDFWEPFGNTRVQMSFAKVNIFLKMDLTINKKNIPNTIGYSFFSVNYRERSFWTQILKNSFRCGDRVKIKF